MISLFTGCGSKEADTTTQSNNNVETQPSSGKDEKKDDQEAQETTEPVYPIVKEPLTLTIFSSIDAKVGATLSSYSEIACFKEMEKITGITVEWLHPPAGQEGEQFNLMLASMDLPDMIWWNWSSVTGGPAKMIDDGIIIRLNEHIDKYSVYLKNLLNTNETVRKQSVLDDGTLYMFPMVRLRKDRPEEWFKTFGWQIRKDWLDRLGLEPPTTIDEMYTVLKEFKEKDANGNGDPNDEIPFISKGNDGLKNLAGAFGVLYSFYNNNGTVKYGPVEPEFKEYLATLNKWYAEGLLDSEYVVTDTASFNAKVTNNIGGMYCGNLAGDMGRFLGLMEKENPEFDLIALPWPIGPYGKPSATSADYNKIVIGLGTAITTKNEHIEETVKWLDYPYGEEGNLLFNFGIEGESYVMENGEPKFTDIILNNPDGYTIDQALSRYNMSSANFSIVKDSRYFEQTALAYPQQQHAQEVWDPADKSLLLPPITLTSEESSRFASIMTEVNTYVDEMFTKFVIGQEPLDKFDEFVDNIKKLGIEEAIQIQQAALDRYNSR